MRLSIHYALRTDLKYRSEIRQMVEIVREYASELPLLRIGEIKEFDEDHRPTDHTDAWLKLQSDAQIEIAGRYHIVPARRTVAFMIWPGEGCEVATFGFSKFPGYIQYKGGQRIATGITGWNWSSFCGTQYASQPQFGGLRNFLHCHISLVRILDFFRKLGLCQVEVRDDSDYWQHRNMANLGKTVGGWNSFVDGITNELSQATEQSGYDLESAVLRFPDFQRLEARGLERLAKLRKQQT